MRQMMSFYPGIGACLCALILVGYPLDHKTFKQIIQDLEPPQPEDERKEN